MRRVGRCLADLIKQAKDHINTLTPAQIAMNKAVEEFNNFTQSCDEALYANDLNQLTESLQNDESHLFYQNMRQAIVKRARELGCVANKEKKTWESPVEFMAITDQQRDEIQGLIESMNLDVKTVCENLGLDALTEIDQQKFDAVKVEICNMGGARGVGSFDVKRRRHIRGYRDGRLPREGVGPRACFWCFDRRWGGQPRGVAQ